MIMLGASEDTTVSLTIKIAEHMSLTVDQVREGARLIDGKTGPQCTDK